VFVTIRTEVGWIREKIFQFLKKEAHTLENYIICHCYNNHTITGRAASAKASFSNKRKDVEVVALKGYLMR